MVLLLIGLQAFWGQADAAETQRGMIRVYSQPSGAAVVFDGELRGQTPLMIKAPLGSYLLRLEKQGYEKVTAFAEFQPQKIRDYTVELRPLSAE